MESFAVLQIRRKVRSYWVEDGLPDIGTGVGFLGLAVLSWAKDSATGSTEVLLKYVQVVAILAFVFLTRSVVQSLKWKMTYPRTGYASYTRVSGRKSTLWVVGAAAVAGGSLLVLVTAVERSPGWTYVVGLSAGMGATFLLVSIHQGWRRGFAYAAVALLAAPIAVHLGTIPPWGDFVTEGGVHFALVGMAQIMGGSLALRRYLRKYPVPIPAGEETL